MKRVCMLLWTSGIRYDSRVRNELATLYSLGHRSSIVVLEYENRAYVRDDPSGFLVRAMRLRSRAWFPRGGGLVFKMVEMYARFAWRVLRARADVVWLHNVEPSGLLFPLALLRRLGRLEGIVWDQHELPPDWMLERAAGRNLLSRLMGAADVVIMANEPRRRYVGARVEPSREVPVLVLDNYVPREFCEKPVGTLPPDVRTWLDGAPYLVAPGGANSGRYVANVVEAALAQADLKLIVVGPYDEAEIRDLRGTFGRRFDRMARFTGLVPLRRVSDYLDGAWASIILYADDHPNNRLCAPNRLYQSIARAVPVIVGSNPPMADLVERLGCGVVLGTDGRSVADIRSGIEALRENLVGFRAAASRHRRDFVWQEQEEVLRSAMEAAGR